MSRISKEYSKCSIKVADGCDGEIFIDHDMGDDYVEIEIEGPLCVTWADWDKISAIIRDHIKATTVKKPPLHTKVRESKQQ